MKTILLFTISILFSITSFSQNVLDEGDSPNLNDLEQSIKNQGGGVYYKENNRNRVLRGINPETKKYETTYPHVREECFDQYIDPRILQHLYFFFYFLLFSIFLWLDHKLKNKKMKIHIEIPWKKEIK